MHKIEKQILLEIKKELNENTPPPTAPTEQQALEWANGKLGTKTLEFMKNNYLKDLKTRSQSQNKKAFLKKLFDKPLLQNKGIVAKIIALFKKSDVPEDETNELDFIEDKQKQRIFKFIYFTLKAQIEPGIEVDVFKYPLTLFGLVKPGEPFVPNEFKEMTPQLIQKIVKTKPLSGVFNTTFFKRGMNLVDDFISQTFNKESRGQLSGETLDQTFYDEQIKNFQASYSPVIGSYRITIGNVIKDLEKKIAANPENVAQLNQVKGELEAYKKFIEGSVAPLIQADSKSFVGALEALISSDALKNAPIKNIFKDEEVQEKFIKKLEEAVQIFQPETNDFIDLTNVSNQTPLDRRKAIIDRLATAIRIQLKQIGRKVDEYTGKTPKSITTQDFLQNLSDKGIDVSEEDLQKVKEIAETNKDKLPITKETGGVLGFMQNLFGNIKEFGKKLFNFSGDSPTQDEIDLIYYGAKSNAKFMEQIEVLKDQIGDSTNTQQTINNSNIKKIIYEIAKQTDFLTGDQKDFKLDNGDHFNNEGGLSVIVRFKAKKLGVYTLNQIAKDIVNHCKNIDDDYQHLTSPLEGPKTKDELKQIIQRKHPESDFEDAITLYATSFAKSEESYTEFMKKKKALLMPGDANDQLSFATAIEEALSTIFKQRETTTTTPNVDVELLRTAFRTLTGVEPGNERAMARVVTRTDGGEAEIDQGELVDVIETGSEGMEEIEIRTNEIVNDQEERGRIEQEIQQDIPEASQQQVSYAVNAAIEAIKQATSGKEGADDADISGFEDLIDKMMRQLEDKEEEAQHDFSELLKDYIFIDLSESNQPTQQDIVAAIGKNGFDSFVEKFSKPMTVGKARELLGKLKELVGRVKQKRNRPDNKNNYIGKILGFIFDKKVRTSDNLQFLKTAVENAGEIQTFKKKDKVEVIEGPKNEFDEHYFFQYGDPEGPRYGKLTKKEFFINLVPGAWKILKGLRIGNKLRLKEDSNPTEEELTKLASSTGEIKGRGNHEFNSDNIAIVGETFEIVEMNGIQKFNNFTWKTSGPENFLLLKGPVRSTFNNQIKKNGSIYVRSSEDLEKYFIFTHFVKDSDADNPYLDLGSDPPESNEVESLMKKLVDAAKSKDPLPLEEWRQTYFDAIDKSEEYFEERTDLTAEKLKENFENIVKMLPTGEGATDFNKFKDFLKNSISSLGVIEGRKKMFLAASLFKTVRNSSDPSKETEDLKIGDKYKYVGEEEIGGFNKNQIVILAGQYTSGEYYFKDQSGYEFTIPQKMYTKEEILNPEIWQKIEDSEEFSAKPEQEEIIQQAVEQEVEEQEIDLKTSTPEQDQAIVTGATDEIIGNKSVSDRARETIQQMSEEELEKMKEENSNTELDSILQEIEEKFKGPPNWHLGIIEDYRKRKEGSLGTKLKDHLQKLAGEEFSKLINELQNSYEDGDFDEEVAKTNGPKIKKIQKEFLKFNETFEGKAELIIPDLYDKEYLQMDNEDELNVVANKRMSSFFQNQITMVYIPGIRSLDGSFETVKAHVQIAT